MDVTMWTLAFVLGLYCKTNLVYGEDAKNHVSESNILHQTLFNNYNQNVIPKYNMTTPLNVRFYLNLTAMDELDEKKQVFSLRGYTQLLWTDELLQSVGPGIRFQYN